MTKARIMVVEDEAIVALDIQNKLESLGYEVPALCANGEEAVAQAVALLPDLVLMDIRLEGGMDGVEAAEQIRQRLHLPVVYLTAYSDESTLERAKVTEPFGYLLKPFEERELHTTVEIVLYRQAAEAEKARLEERLRQARKMEAIGQLTAGLAHNFNDMLQGIIGNLDLALMSAGEELRPFLDNAAFDAERAARLVKQLTLFYHQEQGVYQPVQFRPLLEEMATRCRQTFDRRIALRVEPGPRDLPPVLGNPEQLQRLLINLCTNSRDALVPMIGDPARSPEIRLEVRLTSAVPDQVPERPPLSGRYLRLRVADNGIGMDEKTRERMFEPFFTTKVADQAAGLGLAVVYGIVQDHQGWVECESAPGTGTTVDVFLPVAAAGAPAGAPTPSPVQPWGTGDLRGSETVLIIADLDRFRSILDLMLERHGYHSLVSRNVQDGLELFRYQHQQIDLVILDLSTPEGSVQETLAELRRLDPEVKVLVLTGQPSDRPIWTGVAVLGKPFNTSQLLQAARQLLSP